MNNNDYELSIWTKFFDNSSKQYIETKQNIIASPSLMFKGKAYNINLKENVNGEKTLTFSMAQKIVDEDGQLILNPLISLLTAEKIIKLRNGEEYSYDENSDLSIIDFYNSLDDENKWSEYVIKTVDEDTSSFVNTYTCKETFINELGKNGWSIILDDELENNYGNLKELGNKSLLGSGWSVSDDSYLPISINTEQLFVLPVNTLIHNNLNINNVLNNSIVKTLKDNDIIYFFYSDVEIGEDEDNNKVWKVKNITTDVFGNPCGPQILYKNGEVFNKQDLDENNIILDYDYNYNFNTEPGAFSGCKVYVVGSIEDTISTTKEIFQGNKIIKKIQSHYEPVAKKYVEDWKINPEHKQFVTNDDVANVYCYNETEYITSESLLNYIANSSNFISTSGWEIENNNVILNNNDEYLKIRSLEILEPEQIDQNTVAPSNYLNIKPHVNNFKILNELNLGAIDNTLKNKKFVFRWKPRIIRADQNNNIIKEYNNTSLSSSLNNMSEINVCLITKKKDDNNFVVCSNNLNVTSNYNINNNDIDNATTPEEKKKAKELRGYPETEINNDYERLTFENLPSGVSVDEQNYVYGYLEINNSTIDFEQYDELYLCMNIGGTINLLYEWNILEIQLFDYKEQFYFDDNNVKINYPIFIF